MPTKIDLQLFEGNDTDIELVALQSDGSTPYNLTSAVIEFYAKSRPGQEDSAVGVLVLTSASSSEIEVTDALQGEFTVKIPGSAIADPCEFNTWRVDVIAPGGAPRQTAMYGDFTVVNL